MKTTAFFLFTSFLLCFFFQKNINAAISDPRGDSNNKFGIHVADSNDLPEAAELVNSSGGDWGYVVLVIQDDDRSRDKWQSIMNQLRRLHLIPIIRIATHVDGNSWKIPTPEDAPRWADFLSSLSWPIANRYVVLFNEPNHSKEWGGRIDPEGYAEIFRIYANALENESDNFFILPAGLDFSARTDGDAFDAHEYLERIVVSYPDFLKKIDGWTSHSYPNPGFSSSPTAIGRGSIASFSWERSTLRSLGLEANLPIFITETGWIHSEGKVPSSSRLSPFQVGINLQSAAQSAWTDPDVVAVIPFLLNYQDYPFDIFSFKRIGNNGFYDHYHSYKAIPKNHGNPKQIESVVAQSVPILTDQLVVDTISYLDGKLTNKGESIIDPFNNYALQLEDASGLFTFTASVVPYLEPGETGTFSLTVRSPKTQGSYPVALRLMHEKKVVYEEKIRIFIVPPPSITLRIQPGWKNLAKISKVKFIIYDDHDRIVHESIANSDKNGLLVFSHISRIIPNKKYRLVVIAPYYLPRQITVKISTSENSFTLPRLYPLDFNNDGTLTHMDFFALLKEQPYGIFKRFF